MSGCFDLGGMQFEEKKKEKTNRKDYWLTEGVVVKIVTKKLGEKFYKKKAVVKVERLWINCGRRAVVKVQQSVINCDGRLIC